MQSMWTAHTHTLLAVGVTIYITGTIHSWLALGLILKPHVFTVAIPHHLETMSDLLCSVLFLHNGHLLSNYYELEMAPRIGDLPCLSFLPLPLPARIS